MTAFTDLTRRNQHAVLDTIERLGLVVNATFWTRSSRRNAERERIAEALQRLRKYVVLGDNQWNL